MSSTTQRLSASEAARAFGWEQAHHRGAISAPLLNRLDEGWAVSREKYDNARQTARDARRQFADLMRGFDLLLTPSARGEAPKGLAFGSPDNSRNAMPKSV